MGYGFNVGADAVLLFVRRRNKILFELVNSTQMSMVCCTNRPTTSCASFYFWFGPASYLLYRSCNMFSATCYLLSATRLHVLPVTL